ncbi:hypothetical protein, partial [Pseudoalteromonas sp. S1688]|uniref:hypothetical protein n=1 Tax=Pseudoalteromonas sp. S1688 TaxID=579511 RepID=UPI001BB2BA79
RFEVRGSRNLKTLRLTSQGFFIPVAAGSSRVGIRLKMLVARLVARGTLPARYGMKSHQH